MFNPFKRNRKIEDFTMRDAYQMLIEMHLLNRRDAERVNNPDFKISVSWMISEIDSLKPETEFDRQCKELFSADYTNTALPELSTVKHNGKTLYI